MYLCPSRGRPHNMQRLIDACLITKTQEKFVIRLDDNDPRLEEYLKLLYPDEWIVIVGEQVKAAGAMREAFKEFPNEPYYGFLGDDAIPKTLYWDEELASSAKDWFIAYPDDLLQGKKSATHPVCGGELIRALGQWTLPCLTHLYIDTVLDHIGRELSLLRWRPDIIVEHCHWTVGKAEKDETYERVWNGKNYHTEDHLCFTHWKQNLDLSSLCKKLADCVKEN